jgi:dipeptidyl aminopeptidase/acylaminoacyl peptidase
VRGVDKKAIEGVVSAMSNIRIVAAAAALMTSAIAASSPVFAQSPGHPPVEAFGQLPNLVGPRLSPDGTHMLVIQSFEGRPLLAIYTIGAPAGTKPVAVPSPDWLIADARWAKNDRIIMYLQKNKQLGFEYENAKQLQTFGRAMVIGVTGDDEVVPFRHNPNFGSNVGIAAVEDFDLADPDRVFIPFYVTTDNLDPIAQASRLKGGGSTENMFQQDMFRVNVRTGDADIFGTGNAMTTQWFMDGNGQIVARIDQSINPLTDHLKGFSNGNLRDIASYDATSGGGAHVLGLSGDGKSLVRRALAGKTFGLVSVDLSSGTQTTLFSNPDYDLSEPVKDEWTGRVIGARYKDDAVKTEYFDPAGMALQRGIEQAFPNTTATVVSSDVAGDRVIVGSESPRQPLSYYYLDRKTHQAAELGSTFPGLRQSDLGEMKPYPYAARDGLPIHAYLTIPPGRVPNNLPVVVMPHGGPDSRDAIGFDWWTQFMANRGYAVLQPNFRGSSGYGSKFTGAGLHQWGLKMQDDITDGVKKLIADGIADPKRICIVGASYGGYAALAGATFTPDLYACAVSFAGVSDLPGMLLSERTRNGKDSDVISFWESRIGDDTAQLEATSPARRASQVKCPILLLHGDGDTTVSIAQSETEEAALKAAGKSVRFVRLQGDDHYLRLAATRIQMLKEVEAFLSANIGN